MQWSKSILRYQRIQEMNELKEGKNIEKISLHFLEDQALHLFQGGTQQHPHDHYMMQEIMKFYHPKIGI